MKMLGASAFYLWQEGKPMVLSTIFMALGIIFLKWGILPLITIPYAIISLSTLICTGCAIYFACLWLLDRSFVLNTAILFKRTLK